MVGPALRKNVAAYLVKFYTVSITRACRAIGFPKSMYYYNSVKDDSQLIDKLLELAQQKPTEGQDKYYQRLRLEGYKWNYKRVRRVYKKLGLNIRRKGKKRIPARVREPLHQAQGRNQIWSMDFMSDSLENGRRFRTFNIMDDFSRKALCVHASFSFPSTEATQVMERTVAEHGLPTKIRVDNGPEFTSLQFSEWCRLRGIKIQYIQPGKPTQNAFIERFNRTYRQDVLDAYLFDDIDQVSILSEEWMKDYNQNRPHEALGGITPEQFEKLVSSEKEISFSLETSNDLKLKKYIQT